MVDVWVWDVRTKTLVLSLEGTVSQPPGTGTREWKRVKEKQALGVPSQSTGAQSGRRGRWWVLALLRSSLVWGSESD